MKRNLFPLFCALAAALVLNVANVAFAQTTNVVINDFASGSVGTAPSGAGVEWGDGNIYWDNSQLYPGTTGSAYINAVFSATDGTGNAIMDYICYPGDNWYYINSGGPVPVDISLYTAVQFQVLWDNVNSTINIDQFNNPSTIPGAAYGTASYQEISWCNGGGNAGGNAGNVIGYFTIPDAASNGWATVTVPIPDNLNDTAGADGVVLEKWIANEGSTPATAPNVFFWIANVQLIGTAAPPPPPTVQLQASKPIPGLNVFSSTAQGTFYYDRQEVALAATNGISWVGHDLTSPVTYSFTINGFPQNPATQYACEAYLMMSPNPAAFDNALDYNEANCVVASIQQGAGTALMTFQYKTNNPGTEDYNTIGTVTNNGTALGTWTVSFTSDTNVVLTAPDGSTSSFVFTNASSFAETANPGMYLYLGMQANNLASINQDVSYSQFSITGAPAAMTDNFATDSTLSTNWFKFMASGPAGIFVMPPGAENWVSWTLPAAGFQLQYATKLLGPWTILKDTNDVTVPEVNQVAQLITTNDIPAPANAAYFDMVGP
jgi:hypothetical protein